MVDQKKSTPKGNVNVDTDGATSTEDSDANRKPKARSRSFKRNKHPDASASATTKTSRGKSSKDSPKGMKFTLSTPEDYLEYASYATKKSSGDKKASRKGEKVSESKAKKSRGMKWTKHRPKKKFTFSSPEEYMEYTGRKPSLTKEEMEIKKAEEQLDDTVETVSVSGGNTGNDRVNTASKNDNNSSIYSSSDDDEDDSDIESNNVPTNTGKAPGHMRKNCFARRLTFGDAMKVVVLWGIIATVALLAGRGTGPNNLAVTTPTTEAFTPATTDNSTCSLCSTGTIVRDLDLEIVVADFICSDEESSCSFQCNNSSRAPRVYTCGEVKRLAIESSSQCSDGDSDSDSCTEFQQAASQCCVSDVDEIFSDVP